MKNLLRAIVSGWVLLSPALLVAAPNSASFDRPLVFEPNVGQAPSQVSWTARGQGYELYLTGSGASIVLAEPVPVSAADSSINSKPSVRPQGLPKARMSVVGMNLGGSRPWNAVEGLEPTGGISNYLVGPQKDWHKGIPQYGRVRVKDVYDSIDLVFYGQGHDMEYDFVVRPGGDPNQIRLAFDGVDSMQVDARNGDLVIKTKSGSEMRQVQPKVYQQVGDKKVEVAGGYQIMDNGQAAFRLANYDRRKALVVDPKVEFTTFLEGNGEDSTSGVAVLADGTSYVTGQTYSTDFPTTTFYAVSKICPGNVCPAYIFVTELSPIGKVLGTTLIGGSSTDTARGIAANADGVWVTGTTNSPDFATNSDYSWGIWNGFVARLTPDITRVDWCVGFGGYGDGDTYQGGNAIAVDANDNAYVAGSTYSNSFPTSEFLATPHTSKQKTFGGTVDAFVVKMGPYGNLGAGSSTYLGGAGDDEAASIAVDGSGHAYVTGYTASKNFPVTSAPSHGSLANGGTLAFITELSPDLSSSVYSVELGGTKSAQHPYPLDQGSAIVVDSTNEAYVAGTSCTSDFPTNAKSFQQTPPSACLPQTGPYDTSAFVAKLSNTGSLLYSTYLGGTNGAVEATAIAIDSSENIFVAGVTTTGVFPGATPITLNPTAGFLTKFHPKLYTIDSSIFLGAAISSIAEFEQTLDIPDPIVVPSIMTTGYRYRPGSPSLAGQYLDAFIVDVAYLPTP
jgi:Beta-propeller repeat